MSKENNKKNLQNGSQVKVIINGKITACRTGLKQSEYRVQVGDSEIWVNEEDLEEKKQ